MDETAYSPYASPQGAGPQGEAPPPVSALELSEQQKLAQQHKNGAGWFIWVAVLSQLNSIFMLLNINISFCVGLGISPLVAVVATAIENPEAKELTASGKGAGFAVGLVGMLFFLMIFFFANRRHVWAYILGMFAYAVDGLIFLLFQDFLSIGFHVFALYWMFVGLKAAMRLNRAPAMAANVVMNPVG
jgi:hypothetical protein